MKPLSDYNELFQAGFCRARADWLVGMNGSRLFSCRYKGQLNIGRVQTPTLAMIVQRDYDVSHFVKQKYFTADLVCDKTVFSSERIDEEETADKIIENCADGTAVIKSVRREIKTVNAPKLYDLTTLQREANKIHGYTAQQTLDYIQSLYEAKLVTYPRTDSQYITSDMEQTASLILLRSAKKNCLTKPFILEMPTLVMQFRIRNLKNLHLIVKNPKLLQLQTIHSVRAVQNQNSERI